MPSLKDSFIVLLASIILGIMGAIPFGILAFIFGNGDSARDMFILEAVLLGSWFPIKFLVDLQVKGQSNFRLPKFSVNQLSIFILLVAAIPLLLLLYTNTFLSFIFGAFVYRFTGGSILTALILGIGLQAMNIYRGTQREKAMGTMNNVFMRVQDINQGGFNINIDPSQVTQQTPHEDEAQLIYLPEDNLRERSYDTLADDEPMTINIDPDSVSEQSDDEA